MNREFDLKSIQMRWVLGLTHGGELPDLAADLLGRGITSKSCRLELAELSRNEGGASALFERALDELGCGVMEPTEALRRYTKAISTSILTSEIAPLKGAELIWEAQQYVVDVVADGFHDVDHFVYAASEAQSRPHDRGFFERAIIEEARRWSSTEF